MILLRSIKLLVIYSLIKIISVMCNTVMRDDNVFTQNAQDSSVLNSVYDTMKYNLEMKLQQNMNKINLLSDMRNKRNINEPVMVNQNNMDFHKNHLYDGERKESEGFRPMAYKLPARFPVFKKPDNRRSDYYEDESYTKCNELKPTIQSFHYSKDEDDKHHVSIYSFLLTGLKYLLGGFAILSLPFILLKALFLPLKFFFFLKAIALVKTFFLVTLLFRFLRFNRPDINTPMFGFNGTNKKKLQTIKDILNSENNDDDDVDYKSDDEQISKEDVGSPMYLNTFNSTNQETQEFIDNLLKLIKIKSKDW